MSKKKAGAWLFTVLAIVLIVTWKLGMLDVSQSVIERETDQDGRLQTNQAVSGSTTVPIRSVEPSVSSEVSEDRGDTDHEAVSVSGDVVNIQGVPVRGLHVEICERALRTGEITSIASTESDDRGQFEVKDIHVHHGASGVAFASDGPAWVSEVFNFRKDQRLHLVLGVTTSIVGKVIDSVGIGIDGASIQEVSRFRAPSSHQLPSHLGKSTTVRSRSDGGFELSGLPCGWMITVQAECAGFATCQESYNLDSGKSGATVVMVLHPEATISGHVQYSDDRPAAGMRIRAQNTDRSNCFRSNSGVGVTDEIGNYSIRAIEYGCWNVFVDFDEQQEKQYSSLPIDGLRLTRDSSRGTANFTLSRGGELRVHAVDAVSSLPIRDLWVGIRSAARPRSGAATNAVWTNEDGLATIRLPPGPVQPYVSLIGTSSSKWSKRDCRIEEGETLDVTVLIYQGLKVSGRVLDEADRPVFGARVWFVGAPMAGPIRVGLNIEDDGAMVTTSRSDGIFEFDGVARERKWYLRAALSESGMAIPLCVDSAMGDLDQVVLRIVRRPATHLIGRVVDLSGIPVPRAEVVLVEGVRFLNGVSIRDTASPDPWFRTKTLDDGVFRFDGAWAGVDYEVMAQRATANGGAVKMETGSESVPALILGETREFSDLILHP